MAALHHGATAAATSALHHRRSIENVSLVKPAFFVSSSSTPFPAKKIRRRNHLRPKILKTLKHPIIPKLPPADPIVPVESPPQEIKEVDVNQEIQEFEKSDVSELAENEETQELKEVEVEVSTPAVAGTDGEIGVAGKDLISKYGWWFVGAFVLQTVYAVLFVGLDDIDNKREIVNGSGEIRAKDAVFDGSSSRNLNMGLANGVTGDGNVNVENLEREKEIEEIRKMAKEVREKERLQSKKNGGEDDEGINGGKSFKSGIEEEIDGTMVKLRKKLGKTRPKTPLVGNSGGETKKGVDEVEMSALLYKKKYKFKDFSGDTVEKPKGFVDSRVNGDLEEGDDLGRSVNGDDNGEKQTELSNDDPKGIDAIRVVEEDGKKGMPETIKSTGNTRSKATKTSRQGKKKGVAKPKVVDGKLDVEAVKSGKASDLDNAVVIDKLSAGNGTLRGKGFGTTKSPLKSKSDTGLWWSNLPFVLVIFMQRGSGGEGLYMLKTFSSTGKQVSYTVAFEDQADATNFCYVLESFFEDLGDFKADVAPLTIKELKEAVKSYSLRVLVVKRGQLQLYAGQPLTDAEMALRALIEQH